MQFRNIKILFCPTIIQREPRQPTTGIVASHVLGLFVQDDEIME